MSGIDSRYSVQVLEDNNYGTWKVQVKMALLRESLWSIVNGSEIEPTEAGPREKYAIRRDRALATIVLSVSPKLLYLIGDPVDPSVVWNKLSDQFQRKTWANKLRLRRKLCNLRLHDGDSMQAHLKEMLEIYEELSVIGEPLDETDKVIYLLSSLPESYSTLVTALEANEAVPKIEMVTERLFHEESKIKLKSSEKDKAFLSNRKSYGKDMVCYQCGKPGHIKRFCREKPQYSIETKAYKQHAKLHANKVFEDSSSDSESIGLVINACAVTDQINWVVDSGASRHMTNNTGLFSSYAPLEKFHKVEVGDGRTLDAIGSGNVVLYTKIPDDKVVRCVLKDVLYIPELAYNLISVSKVSETGKKVQFTENICSIYDADDKLTANASKVGNLYILDIVHHESACTAGISKDILWHKRYGHLSMQNMQKLKRDGLVSGLDFPSKLSPGFVCSACAYGKSKQAKFPSGSIKTSQPLQLIHSDVCGPIQNVSLGGCKYFVTFIDDFTRYVWVYVLKHKNEVMGKFQEWKNLVENQLEFKVKSIRTDCGGEYISTAFEHLLKSNGIRHEKSIPKTPEQNGVSERMNLTLMDKVRSMIYDSGVPKKFWAEALSTAVFIRNRCPTRSINLKTPFEMLYGLKPNVENFKVFGSVAYALVPKTDRKKLDSKSSECIFVGYGSETKGYRLFDLSKNRIIFSRSVKFDEAKFFSDLKLGYVDAKNINSVQIPDSFSSNSDSCLGEPSGSPSIGEPSVLDACVEEPSVQVNDIPRRSTRISRPPDRYGDYVYVADEISEPKSAFEALSGPESDMWKNSMQREYDSILSMDVWDLVSPPVNRKIVPCKWVFKKKTDSDGNVIQYKSRLVAQGFSQVPGLDYAETFSPVARFESVRTLTAMAVKFGLKLHHMDVSSAFLNGDLEEEIYMKQPPCFEKNGFSHLVCKLKKSIYGLKQSPRCWNSSLHSYLLCIGFTQSLYDPCVYTQMCGDQLKIIAVYVDDLIICCKSLQHITDMKDKLSSRYNMKDLGDLNYFLGVKIVLDYKKGLVSLLQTSYVEKILERFGMSQSKPVKTPYEISTQLTSASEGEKLYPNLTEYQAAVGALIYLTTHTRPDIAFAVGQVSRFCNKPSETHWSAVKRIFRYLSGTKHFGLLYQCCEDDLIGYSDADWAGNREDRRSTSGFVFMLSGAAISWASKKQPCVALSTAEAEYISLSNAAQEVIWLRNMLGEFGCPQLEPTVLHEDNQSAITISKNPQFHSRTKHIDIKFHFIRDQIERDVISVKYCPTEDMLADIFTKGLSFEKFAKFRALLGCKNLNDDCI